MKTVVLLSGGLDSMVVAAQAAGAGELLGCVFIDYGHPAQIPEGWKAFAFCGARGIPLKVVHVFGLALGDMAAGTGARVVPARNAVLLSCAANAAIAMGADGLAIGAIADDFADYPDCRPAFFDLMDSALGIRVLAPLSRTRKRDVVLMARELGLHPSDAWSCYGPGPQPCGACPSCVQRDRAEAP